MKIIVGSILFVVGLGLAVFPPGASSISPYLGGLVSAIGVVTITTRR